MAEFEDITQRKQLKKILSNLLDAGYPLSKLTGCKKSKPVASYHKYLNSQLRSQAQLDSTLVGIISEMLEIAESTHIPYIVQVATLFAYHLIPEEVRTRKDDQGTHVWSDEPAPAVYRLLHDLQTGAISQVFEYPTRNSGIASAIPVSRKALVAKDQINVIADRVDNRVDEIILNAVGRDSYKIKKEKYTPEMLETLNHELGLEAGRPNSRFLYAEGEDVFTEEIPDQLRKFLPNLKYYTNEATENYEAESSAEVICGREDAIKVTYIKAFQNTVGHRIDQRLIELRGDGDAKKFQELVMSLQRANTEDERLSILKLIDKTIHTADALSSFAANYPEAVGFLNDCVQNINSTASWILSLQEKLS